MGSSSSPAPPPDPRLVEAQIRSMGIQDDAIARMIANAETFMPLQREQTQVAMEAVRQGMADARQAAVRAEQSFADSRQAFADSRKLFADSQEDRTWMLGRRGVLSGLQDRLVSDANDFNLDQRSDSLARQAGADASVAIANARSSSARDLARRGIMPGTGRSDDTALVLGEAALKAGGMNTARRAARQEGYALTDRATNALAGYPAMGMQATGQSAMMSAGGINASNLGLGASGAALNASGVGANMAMGGLSAINSGLAGMNSGYGSAAGIAGQMGANATGMFNAQAGFKNAQDQIAASSDPFNTMLGAASGAAMTKFLSDPRLKTGVVPVGRDERTGLGLYEFAYIGATDGKRYRGVMADEVERKYPDAVSHDDLGFASVDYGRLGLEMVEV